MVTGVVQQNAAQPGREGLSVDCGRLKEEQ
jgi:hypothetical protein